MATKAYTVTLNADTVNYIEENARLHNEPAHVYITRICNTHRQGELTPEERLLLEFEGIDDHNVTYDPARSMFGPILAQRGTKRNVSARIPDSLSEKILGLINNSRLPYKTMTEFVVDALYHRVQQIQLYKLGAKMEADVNKYATILRVQQQGEETDMYVKNISKAIEDYDVAKAHVFETGDEVVKAVLTESIAVLEDLQQTAVQVSSSVRTRVKLGLQRLKAEQKARGE